MHLLSSLVLALLSTPGAHAWGALGHATVAQIATHYLHPSTKAYVSSLLGPGVTMASVASWADAYRATPAGHFSAPYHYIDAEDHPPASCSVDLLRDCGPAGCVVSAIANYTTRALSPSLPLAEKKQALEFLIHFIGDVTQPLHDEAEALGGNDIPVTWNGAPTNLHACWDTQMVEKAAGGANTTAVLEAFSAVLVSRIEGGSYKTEAREWVGCVDVFEAETCALQWARDANAFNCRYVLKANETGVELDGAYYVGAEPIVEMQLAKGGYRLGAFLNELAKAAKKAGKGEKGEKEGE